MKTTIVRYKTTAAYADANEAAVRAVFAEVRSRAPAGFRYACHRLPDGATFVHVATLEHEPPPGAHPLTSLPAFQAFQSRLRENLVEPPVVTEAQPFEVYGDSLPPSGAKAS